MISLRPARRARCPRRCARNMSPVETCGIPYSAEMRFACVPFPAPCGPRTSRFTRQEALVGAHHHLRLHLAHRVERDADDDQHRGAAERADGRLREAELLDEDRRQHRDDREEQRAGQRQARQHAVEVLRGRRARADAGDVAAVLAQVVGLVDRVELDRGVEVREDDDQQRLDAEVRPRRSARSAWLMNVCVLGANEPIVCGSASSAAAKMTGMTPAMFTRSGM